MSATTFIVTTLRATQFLGALHPENPWRTSDLCYIPHIMASIKLSMADGALKALEKLNGHMVLNRPIAVRLAKNVKYDEWERPKPKIEIPALGTAKKEGKVSKEEAIKAIEQKLKILESETDHLEFNQSLVSEVPLIQKYQFNKDRDANSSTLTSQRRAYHKTYSGPYSRHQRP